MPGDHDRTDRHERETRTRDTLFVLGFVVLVCAAAGIALVRGARPEHIAIMGFTAFAAIIVAFAAAVLWQIINGRIDLYGIIAEPQDVAQIGGRAKASLSRFQFLIFTFVIAGLFLMLSIESGGFVNVPDNVLLLLGISGGGFIVSKSVGFRRQNGDEAPPPAPPAPPPVAHPAPPPPSTLPADPPPPAGRGAPPAP